MKPLTFTTCQAESTEPIVAAIAAHLTTKRDIPAQAIENIPWQERYRQIADGRIDIGWICGSYYTKLADEPTPMIELLAAPVMNQARYQGQPVYFSDVVVRADSPFQTFADLRGASFAYNEPGSFSGYWSMRSHLARIGEGGGFFGRLTQSGAHLNSLQMIIDGRIDTAAIDSMVMAVELQENSDLAHKIRIVEVIGPTPIPPWVIRRSLPEAQKTQLRQALLSLPETEDGRQLLQKYNLRGFTAVPDAHYDKVRQMITEAANVYWPL